jgi:uncharacterized protein (TIGR02996 family)
MPVDPPLANWFGDPEFEAMVAAVAAAPLDDAPRLVLSDWLRERGDDVGANWAARPAFLALLAIMRLAHVRMANPDELAESFAELSGESMDSLGQAFRSLAQAFQCLAENYSWRTWYGKQRRESRPRNYRGRQSPCPLIDDRERSGSRDSRGSDIAVRAAARLRRRMLNTIIKPHSPTAHRAYST